jgi:APA family basic amino acid/polyamine antiporter
VTFANYALALTGLDASLRLPMAVGAIVLLSAVNYVGVRPGAITQNVFTVLKLVPLALLAAAGVFAAAPVTAAAPAPPSGFFGLAAAIGTALVPVLFSYGGWQQTNYVAEELIDAERNLPRALLLGVAGVVVVYLLANFAYLRALGPAGLAASTAPAADAMRALVGSAGERIVTAGIAVSTFGFLNLVILVSPRVYQAMAADGLFFPALSRLHPRYRTPSAAILVQGGWAILLTLTGTYGELLDYVVFGDWIFFALAAAALYVFRRREGAPPPGVFRVPGYPVTPALFILAAVYVLIGSVTSNPSNAVRGTLLLVLGVPVFLFWRSRAGRDRAGGEPRR